MGKRPPGLAKLIKTLLIVCAVIGKFQAKIRVFVPEGDRAAYDAALAGIMGGCDVLRAIDYMDQNANTNPLWGEQSPIIG